MQVFKRGANQKIDKDIMLIKASGNALVLSKMCFNCLLIRSVSIASLVAAWSSHQLINNYVPRGQPQLGSLGAMRGHPRSRGNDQAGMRGQFPFCPSR